MRALVCCILVLCVLAAHAGAYLIPTTERMKNVPLSYMYVTSGDTENQVNLTLIGYDMVCKNGTKLLPGFWVDVPPPSITISHHTYAPEYRIESLDGHTQYLDVTYGNVEMFSGSYIVSIPMTVYCACDNTNRWMYGPVSNTFVLNWSKSRCTDYSYPEIESSVSHAALVKQSVKFEPSYTSDCVISYVWNLGDGTVATTENVTHAYSARGDYTVTLTTTMGSGGVVESTRQQTTTYKIIVYSASQAAEEKSKTLSEEIVSWLLSFFLPST